MRRTTVLQSCRCNFGPLAPGCYAGTIEVLKVLSHVGCNDDFRLVSAILPVAPLLTTTAPTTHSTPSEHGDDQHHPSTFLSHSHHNDATPIPSVNDPATVAPRSPEFPPYPPGHQSVGPAPSSAQKSPPSYPCEPVQPAERDLSWDRRAPPEHPRN